MVIGQVRHRELIEESFGDMRNRFQCNDMAYGKKIMEQKNQRVSQIVQWR